MTIKKPVKWWHQGQSQDFWVLAYFDEIEIARKRVKGAIIRRETLNNTPPTIMEVDTAFRLLVENELDKMQDRGEW